MLLPDPEDEPIVTDHLIYHLTEEEGFDPKAGMAEWLLILSKRNKILVTCLSSSKRKLVSDVMAQCGLRAVHLADSFVRLSIFEQASKLTGWWEKIVKQSYRLKPGESIVVSANGMVGDK